MVPMFRWTQPVVLFSFDFCFTAEGGCVGSCILLSCSLFLGNCGFFYPLPCFIPLFCEGFCFWLVSLDSTWLGEKWCLWQKGDLRQPHVVHIFASRFLCLCCCTCYLLTKFRLTCCYLASWFGEKWSWCQPSHHLCLWKTWYLTFWLFLENHIKLLWEFMLNLIGLLICDLITPHPASIHGILFSETTRGEKRVSLEMNLTLFRRPKISDKHSIRH